MHVAARVRVRARLARSPILYWLVVVALAAIAASAVAGAVDRARDERDRWGTTRTVWVAARDLDAGMAFVVERRDLPVAAVPDAAVVAEPVGVTHQRLAAGEIVVEADVGTGPAARLDADHLGVSLGADETTLPVSIGDHVAVVVDGAIVVDDAIVIDRRERAVVVAVPMRHAATVAAAARLDAAVLAWAMPG